MCRDPVPGQREPRDLELESEWEQTVCLVSGVKCRSRASIRPEVLLTLVFAVTYNDNRGAGSCFRFCRWATGREVRPRPSNKSSRDLLFIFLFFMDAVKSHSVQLDKMSQNVQDKLKPVTPSVAFSETQSY